MSEFNGKKFYGFSLENDPALSTTTRNFEFKYTCPEQLERAIQKVQRTDKTTDKQKKSDLLNKYCKVPNSSTTEKTSAVQSRDNDIETHMSRIRPLSENEVDQIIDKAKPTLSTKANPDADNERPTNKPSISGYGDVCIESPEKDGNCLDKRRAETDYEDDDVHVELAYAYSEKYTAPILQWVEIVETHQGMATLIEDVSEESNTAGVNVIEISTLPFDEPTSEQEVNMAETLGYAHSGQNEDDDAEAEPEMYSPMAGSLTGADPDNNNYVVDSDLEFELIDREKYSKYRGPRPREEDMRKSSNESGGFAQFIEVEPDMSYLKNASPMRYTDLTDETQEDPQHVAESQEMKVIIKNLAREEKVQPKVSKYRSPYEDHTKEMEFEETKPEKETKKKSTYKSKQILNIDKDRPPSSMSTPRGKHVRIAAPYEASLRNLSIRSPRANRPSTAVPAAPPSTRQRSTLGSGSTATTGTKLRKVKAGSLKDNNTAQQNHLERTMKNLIISKSIEDLKIEKLALFTKMTTTQERTIELLDKLRVNLLEIYVPNNSYEKSKRQKNAFEFSVRFSRNFLYPLKGMIEDLKLITVDQLNSASSNDATARVSAIYALIYQSLQTYQKQLRYFLLDQVPQKLATLIEMVYATTNLCLEKGVFDRHDAIIDCLQERCTKFLGFLEDMHEERFMTARENYKKFTVEKSHSNYNLKMFMNDLNMYEPKLVPKNIHQKKRGLRRIKKGTGASLCDDSSDMLVKKGHEDTVSTQMGEKFNKMATESVLTSMQNLLSSSSDGTSIMPSTASTAKSQSTQRSEMETAKSFDLPHGDSPVNKTIMDALQIVTKQQIREVLEPFMQTLGSALQEKNDPETLETILNAFKTKVNALTKCDQRKQVDGNKEQPDSEYESADEQSAANATRALKTAKQTKMRASKSYVTVSPTAAQQRRRFQHNKREEIGDDEDDAEESNSDSYDDDENDMAGGARRGGGRSNSNKRQNGKENADDLSESEETDEVGDDDDDESSSSGSDSESQNDTDESTEEQEQEPQTEPEPEPEPKPKQQQPQLKAKREAVATIKVAAPAPQPKQQPKLRGAVPRPTPQKIKLDPKKPDTKKQKQKPTTSSAAASSRLATRKPISNLGAARQSAKGPVSSASSLPRTVSSKLYRRRRNPNNSPPPPPAVSPSTSARRQARTPQQQLSDPQLGDDERTSEEHMTHSIQNVRQDRDPESAHGNGGSRKVLLPSMYTLKPNHSSVRDSGDEGMSGQDGSGVRLHGHAGDAYSIHDFEVPLTNAFDLVESMSGSSRKSAIKRAQQMINFVHGINVATDLGDDDDDDDDDEDEDDQNDDKAHEEDREKAVNAFIEKALSELKQSTVPLHVNSNPYESNRRPTQQELHEHELRQQRLQQQKEELRVQRLKLQQLHKQLPQLLEGGGNANLLQQLQQLQQQQQEQLIDHPRSSNRNENYIQCGSAATTATATANCNSNNNNKNANNGNDIVVEDIPNDNYDDDLDNNANANNKNNNTDDNAENVETNQYAGMKVFISKKKPYIDVKGLLAKRDNFLKACNKNRFYSNPNYAEPWKVFSKLSDKLTNEVVATVERDFCMGVSKFVDDFIALETQM